LALPRHEKEPPEMPVMGFLPTGRPSAVHNGIIGTLTQPGQEKSASPFAKSDTMPLVE